jgi:GAG-pre-integrase domain/Integrase core domain
VSISTGSDEKLHGKVSKTNWLLNSGAFHHMSGDLKRLQCVYQISSVSVVLPNGDHTVVKKEDSVVLDGIVLNRVLYVSNMNCNLISLSKLIKDSDCFITFANEWCVIQDHISRMLIGVGEKISGVYYYCSVTRSQAFHVKKSADYRLWHQRMGHPSIQTTILLSGVKSNSSISEGVCEICLRAKQTREFFSISSNKAVESFALIHCDIWGPYRVASHCGAHYFLTIIDDFSRSVWVYLMAKKKEVADVIMEFCTMVTTQFEKSVKCIRSDNGLEFKSRLIQ